MSIVVLEGIDCSGKDTLAELLVERTGFEHVRGSSFEIAELGTEYMFKYMMDLLDRDNIIINRFFMSNYVYGNLFNYPTMTDEQFLELAKKANDKALTVYLTANAHTIKSRMLTRGDDMIETKDVEGILKMYNKVLNDGLTTQKIILQLNTSYIHNMNLLASMITEIVELSETRTMIKNDFSKREV